MKKKVKIEFNIQCGETSCDNCWYLEYKSQDCFCATLDSKYIMFDSDSVPQCQLTKEVLEHKYNSNGPDIVMRSETCIKGECNE